MRRLVFAIGIMSVSMLAVPAVLATGVTAAGAAPPVALSIKNFAFSPATLTVQAGTTVRVTNDDSVTHTFASDPGDAQSWDSGPINPGSSFSVTFAQPGRFGFHCNIHTFMTGTVVVDAAPATTTAPPPPTTAPTNTAAPGTPATTAPAVVAAPPTTGGPQVRAAATRTSPLPHTGSSSGPLTALAATLTLVGAACLALAGSSRRRAPSRSPTH